MLGKALRMQRFTHSESKRICLIPLDHGITMGPIAGLRDYIKIIGQILNGGADAIIVHKGLLKTVLQYKELLKGRYIMHLSASTIMGPDPSAKVLVGSVEEAVKLGADGVSIHVNLGCKIENQMLVDFGKVSAECQEWGMPLLAMVYTQSHSTQDDDKIFHAARIAEELGADMAKVDCPNTSEGISKLVQSVNIPVLVAGGAKVDEPEGLLKMIDGAMRQGIKGVAVGRNVFQCAQPRLMTELISKMVHNEIMLEEALADLKRMREVALCTEMK